MTNANFLAVSKENFLIDQIFSILVLLVSSLFAQIVHFYSVLIIFLVLLSTHTMANNIYLRFHQVQFLFLLHLLAIYQPWNFKFPPPVCLRVLQTQDWVWTTLKPAILPNRPIGHWELFSFLLVSLELFIFNLWFLNIKLFWQRLKHKYPRLKRHKSSSN